MRVAFDIGGTFTDVIALKKSGGIATSKVLSLLDKVPQDLANLIESENQTKAVSAFVHGTTQISNAVIESKTAKIGFLTTRGFRDNLEIRSLRRPQVYDVAWERPPALVPRHLRLEIDERILADGTIETPLNETSATIEIKKLLKNDVAAIGVCLINSYSNPSHEQQLGDLIKKLAPNVPVCISSDINPEIREYERASTTAINASLIPVLDRYLDNLQRKLSTYSPHFLVMQSNGGIMSADAARSRPCYIIESGPAAGVLAAAKLAKELKLSKVLSLDMGGTTAKACLIDKYEPLEKPGGEIGAGAVFASRGYTGMGHAVRVPSIDLAEVGAGGGSVAWIDAGGLLKVGPHSAGANPGPVCYGGGGTEPTVTDANLALGYINPHAIADSSLAIDKAAAIEAIETKLAKPLERSVPEVAYAITQIANSVMSRAIRSVSTERGRDPREFTLIVFGGAGPMHAATLAESIGITNLVVPMFSGIFSAVGLLLADYRQDYVASIADPIDRLDWRRLVREYENLKAKAIEDLRHQGIAEKFVRFDVKVDLKYKHQISELALPIKPPVKGTDSRKSLVKQFHAIHQEVYGHHIPDEPVMMMNLRLRATASAGKTSFGDLAKKTGQSKLPLERTRQAYFGPKHGTLKAKVRARTEINKPERGPLIVEDPDTTVVVPPGWSVRKGRLNILHLTKAS